jgi:hypothetical protein
MRLMAVVAVGLLLVGVLVFLTPRRNEVVLQPPEQPTSEDDVPEEQPVLVSPVQPAARRAEPSLAITPSVTEFPTVSSHEDRWISIEGFVLPAEGRTSLWERPWVNVYDSVAELTRVQAEGDGAYSIEGLSPGSHWVSAGSSSDGNARTVVELDASRSSIRLDLQLSLPPEILVRVVDQLGGPVENKALLAIATLDPPEEWFTGVRGSWSDHFGVGHLRASGHRERLPPEYLGRIVLDHEPPVFVSIVRYHYVVATQSVAQGQTEVEFVVDPGAHALGDASLRLRAVDAGTREPIAGATVLFDGAGASRRITLNDDGVMIRSCLPGWHRLGIMAKGYENGERVLRVEPGVVNDLGDVPLGSAQSISGVIVDEAGQGVAIPLRCDRIDPSSKHEFLDIIRQYRTSADGAFRIGNLSRGTYRLHANRDEPWGLDSWIVDTRNGSVENLRLRLARGVPLVVHGSEATSSSVSFEIFNADGLSVLSSRLSSPAPRKILLAPGYYEIEVRTSETEEPARRPFTVGVDPVAMSLP